MDGVDAGLGSAEESAVGLRVTMTIKVLLETNLIFLFFQIALTRLIEVGLPIDRRSGDPGNRTRFRRGRTGMSLSWVARLFAMLKQVSS